MIKHYNINPPVLNIFCATYFLTSITTPDLKSSDMLHGQMMSALPLASARLSKIFHS